MIQTTNLTRSYRLGKKNLAVLRGINLTIERGEKIFLCGPSGAGKTTLLYTLAGLETPEQGRVIIDDVDIYTLNRGAQSRFRNQRIGYIFQNYYLLPELTALENVMVPGAIAGKNQADKALAALGRVGLAERADHLPTELSGGEQQRVAIARAIVNEPQILFADEPTGNVDPPLARRLLRLFVELHRSGTSVVIATHDLSLMDQFNARRMVLNEGRLQIYE